MPTMTALREFRYASAQRFAGDTFEASAKDADLLQRIGKATLADVAPRSRADLPKAAYQTKAEEAPAEPEAPLPASQYLRRDMQAGPIGEETPVPSSRRGRPRKRPISDISEDDAG